MKRIRNIWNIFLNFINILNYIFYYFIEKQWNNFLNFIERQTYRLIIISYLSTVVLSWVPNKYWGSYYFLISNLLGYSIISNLLIAPKIFKERKRFCEIMRAMIISLIISNLFSIIALWISREYYTKIFDRYFLFSFTILFYIYYFKKKKIYKQILKKFYQF